MFIVIHRQPTISPSNIAVKNRVFIIFFDSNKTPKLFAMKKAFRAKTKQREIRAKYMEAINMSVEYSMTCHVEWL